MIESARYVIDKTIKPITESFEILKKSESVAKYSEEYVSDIKKLNSIVVSARTVLNNMKYTGNILDYLNKNSSANETRELFLKYDFVPFEEIIDDFKIKFENELEERFTVNDLIINEIYTTWDFVYLANLHSTRTPGILPVNNEIGVVTSVVARGKFKGDQKYKNTFLENGDVLYYLIEGNHKYNDYILNDRVPIHLFETVGSNMQKYKGTYTLKNIIDNRSIIIRKEHLVIPKKSVSSVIGEEIPKIKGRGRYKNNSNRKSPGSREVNKRKQESGDRAEMAVIELLSRKNILSEDVSKNSKYNFDVLVKNNSNKIGLEVKNISNGVFYMSNTEIEEFRENKTRLCFVEIINNEKKVFISKEYNETIALKKILNEVTIIKEEIITNHMGRFKINDIEIAIVNDSDIDFNEDFNYVVDYTQLELLNLLNI